MQEFLSTLISNQSQATNVGYGTLVLVLAAITLVSIVVLLYNLRNTSLVVFSFIVATISAILAAIFTLSLLELKADAENLIESDIREVIIIKDISSVSAVDAARAGMKVSKNDYDSVQSGTIDFLTDTDVSPMSVYIVTRDNEVEIFEKVSSKSVTISKSEFEDMKE